jgi:hypothetical protein
MQRFPFKQILFTTCTEEVVNVSLAPFISLSDVFESVESPDPEVTTSGTVLNVALYRTTRLDLWIRICH